MSVPAVAGRSPRPNTRRDELSDRGLWNADRAPADPEAGQFALADEAGGVGLADRQPLGYFPGREQARARCTIHAGLVPLVR